MNRITPNLRRIVGFIAIVGAVFGVWWLLWWRNDPGRHLARMATAVEEWSSPASFTGDGVRVFRAQCSEDAFHQFARLQKLTNRVQTTDDLRAFVGWTSECPEKWWNPPRTIVGAYYYQREGGHRRLLGFNEGRLYYELIWW